MDITKIDEETTFTLQKIIYDALCITRTPDDPLPIEAVNALTDLSNIARISERQWRQSNQEYPRWHGWTNWETWLVNLQTLHELANDNGASPTKSIPGGTVGPTGKRGWLTFILWII